MKWAGDHKSLSCIVCIIIGREFQSFILPGSVRLLTYITENAQ